MKKTISVVMCILAMAVCIPSQAEEHIARKNEKPIHMMFAGDTVNVRKAFKENAPSSYNIPGMPRFAIFGKEGKFYLGVGGTVKGVMGYDLGNPVNSPNDFIVSSIPMRREKGDGGKFFASAGESGIFLNVVALPGSPNQLSAYVMFDFSGNNYAPSLQDAYIRYRGFKVGYTSSLFTDEAAISPTIDSQGPNAFTSVTNTVLDYELVFGKKKEWKFGVGLELPQVSLTNTTSTRKVNQRVPDIPAYIQYSWMNGSGKIRLSGLIRNLYYRDVPTGRNVDNLGWGIQLSGYTPIAGGFRPIIRLFTEKESTTIYRI